jgi:hypothetical protein
MGAITNVQIAKLNEFAYKGVRKGVAKQLDQRAVNNQAYFDKLDNKLQAKMESLNKEELTAEHGELMEKIGDCPISANSLVDSMMDGDCMGICLDIGRSEATIMDPSKLVIKKVIPTYMSLDSFLDSSIFELKKN